MFGVCGSSSFQLWECSVFMKAPRCLPPQYMLWEGYAFPCISTRCAVHFGRSTACCAEPCSGTYM